ncbi:hypothetical protein K9N68_38110 (plasmid) [Kovacikia minuta CCNUW1]|uniref:hypothetical protein n=1 Tax=Kovacikia minuta TaxID=2931930 RepID=UPI001CCE1277|nr:hypothetical protein [Kovacikia minuta]UBF30018.1 hypothetical protein K9N68_38110 [Kovacikia minuta CCNUW1]
MIAVARSICIKAVFLSRGRLEYPHPFHPLQNGLKHAERFWGWHGSVTNPTEL